MSGGPTLPPYAASLGVVFAYTQNDLPVIACDPAEHIRGRPGFWHGGVLASLLETAALAAAAATPFGEGKLLRAANLTIQFTRGGGMERVFAQGSIERAGRRLLNLRAEAWQQDRARPIATATMNVMLVDR